MITRKAPAAISALSTGAVALVLGAWCGPAFASVDVEAPSAELASHTESSLQEILSNDEIASPDIRTISKDSSAKQQNEGEKEDVTISKSETPEIATRLPGVSTSDSPRFRRLMYRTDI